MAYLLGLQADYNMDVLSNFCGHRHGSHEHLSSSGMLCTPNSTNRLVISKLSSIVFASGIVTSSQQMEEKQALSILRSDGTCPYIAPACRMI